jgi:hypothetical protein
MLGGMKIKRTGAVNYVTRLVSYLLILLPAALAFLYVRAFGVSVVFADAWSMVRLFDKWSSGSLRLSDLFDQHNEHRMFFPESVELLLGSITQYDNVAEMYLVVVCFLATLICLLLAFRDNVGSWLFFVPVSFLIFSFRQHENMLWGYQISFAFAQTFGVLALFLLYVLWRKKYKKLPFVAALGSATVASFSVAQGLFVWPAGLLQLTISPLERPAKRVFVAVWGLVGLGEWIAYFADYETPGGSPALSHILEHPVAGAQYFLGLLGASLFWSLNSALAGGLLLVGLTLVSLFLVYKDKKFGEYSFWIALLLFSLLILASITYGRSGFGLGQGLVSRYTTFSILAVVSVYAMLTKTALERRSRTNTVLLVAFSAVALSSVAISYWKGTEVGREERMFRERAAFVLSTYESQPDKALAESLHPRPALVRRTAPILQSLGYNVFSGPQTQGLPPLSDLSPVASTASFGMVVTGDGVSQRDRSIVVAEEGSFIKLTGWAVDDENESTAGGVYVDIDGRLFPAFYGMERQDVADALGAPSYRYSGFERALPISEIGAGTHELSVVVLTADREGYYRTDQKVTLEVR